MSARQTPTSASAAAESAESSVLSLLQRIKAGTLHPANLSADDRQRVVEHLTAEGYSVAETAEILKTSERTIARDRKLIRQANALARDPALVEQFVGNLVREAENCISRIRRAGRDKETVPAVRIDAEHRVYQIASDLISRLQSLGYLPLASHKIEARLQHRVAESDDPAELGAELARLLQIGAEAGAEAVDAAAPLKNLQHMLTTAVVDVGAPVAPEVSTDEEPTHVQRK